MVSRSSGKRSLKKSINKRSKKRGKQAKDAQSATGKKGRSKKGKAAAAGKSDKAGSEVEEELSPRQELILESAAAARRKTAISFVTTTVSNPLIQVSAACPVCLYYLCAVCRYGDL